MKTPTHLGDKEYQKFFTLYEQLICMYYLNILFLINVKCYFIKIMQNLKDLNSFKSHYILYVYDLCIDSYKSFYCSYWTDNKYVIYFLVFEYVLLCTTSSISNIESLIYFFNNDSLSILASIVDSVINLIA